MLAVVGLAAVALGAWSLLRDSRTDGGSNPDRKLPVTASRRTSTALIPGNFMAVTDDAADVIAAGDDRIVQIDPETNRQVDGILVGGVPLGAVGEPGQIWVVLSNARGATLLRVDTDGLTVRDKIPIPGDPIRGTPALGFGSLWIPTRSGVLRYSDTAKTFLPVPSLGVDHVRDLSFSAGKLWVSGTRGSSGKVVAYDPAANAVTATADIKDPAGIAARTDSVWIADRSTRSLVKIDPANGRVMDSVALGQGVPEWVAVRDTPVWVLTRVRRGVGRVVFVDPATNQPTGKAVDVAIKGRSAEPALQFHSLWIISRSANPGIVKVGLAPNPA